MGKMYKNSKIFCSFQKVCTKGAPIRVRISTSVFMHEHQRPDRDGFVDVVSGDHDLTLFNNLKIWKETLSYRLYTPYDYHSIMQYSSQYKGETIITPHNQHYEDMMKQSNDLSIGDEVALNLHFNCPISASQFSRYMVFFENYLHHELKQFDIRTNQASQRSFLLNPYRVFIETFDDAEEMHPKLAGEYRRKYSKEGVPFWKHVDFELILIYLNNRWIIKDSVKDKIIARTKENSKRMLTNEEWYYYNTESGRWVIGLEDVFLNLFPEHEESQASGKTVCPAEWVDYGGEYCYHISSPKVNWLSAQKVFYL